MDQNTKKLEERVAELEKLVKALQNSSTIPYTVDNSFLGRGFLKLKAPAIFLNGLDQGAWLNVGVGNSGMAFPPAFGQITEGAFAGLWVPLYIPPRQIT